MTKTPRKWDILSKARKEELLREISIYFKEEFDQEIGILATEELLDFFLDNLGKDIYEKAVKDSRAVIKQNLDNLEVDLDLLY